ncbi:MAG: AraC family ligand binding domain-containing protein, partial [Ruthenibacterium sp.]
MSGFHFHKSYELILFMCDNATMHIENRVYHVEKGDLFLINDKEYHKTSGVKDAEYNRYVLMFEPQKFQQLEHLWGCTFLQYFEVRPENFIHKVNLKDANL